MCKWVEVDVLWRYCSMIYGMYERGFHVKLIVRTPPLGGVSFLGGLRTQRKRTQVKNTPIFPKNWGCFSGGLLFLRVLCLETTQKENPPGRGCSFDQSDGSACSTSDGAEGVLLFIKPIVGNCRSQGFFASEPRMK